MLNMMLCSVKSLLTSVNCSASLLRLNYDVGFRQALCFNPLKHETRGTYFGVVLPIKVASFCDAFGKMPKNKIADLYPFNNTDSEYYSSGIQLLLLPVYLLIDFFVYLLN